MRSALDVLYYTGSYTLMEPIWSGVGVIFTLHHVRPQRGNRDFCPTGSLRLRRISRSNDQAG